MHASVVPTAAARFEAAEAFERSHPAEEAVVQMAAAAAAAECEGDWRTQCRALRRLAVLQLHLGQAEPARGYCQRSYDLAVAHGDHILAAEALNTSAAVCFESGDIVTARDLYARAAALGADSPGLRARVEQNLGILANIQGDLSTASSHYQASLDAYSALADERGRGLVLHNLGMLSADRSEWDRADDYFRRSRTIAEALGESHLSALCALNHSEVHLARQQYESARLSAEAALAAFEQIGSRIDKADAYRVLGTIFRETGRLTLSESRLQAARALASEAGSTLSEAEATRELALLRQAMGRNQEALTLLSSAHALFARLDARLDLVDVGGKRDKLEATYLAVVRQWGESIESADSYTFGHCERVARYAVAVAEALGLDEAACTTIRLGAYLHDVGKIRVPHEILNKAGKLTDEEFRVMQSHPVWGVDLLEGIEFPWDIKPIIRWHHEKHDGSGYPDGLRGDEIPVAAQVLCVADVYDALTTTRSYRAAMSHPVAMGKMTKSRHWWHPEVFQGFLAGVAAPREASA